MPEFKAYKKTSRLENVTCRITEKLDGTNALIYIDHDTNTILAGSRSRWLMANSKTKDNFGFGAWVEANRDELLKLPNGYHYGEWVGKGIQRGYNMSDRQLYLFNQDYLEAFQCKCVKFVPFIKMYSLSYLQTIIDQLQEQFIKTGSILDSNTKAEGLIIELSQGVSTTKLKVIWDK